MQNPFFLQSGWFVPVHASVQFLSPPPPDSNVGVGIPPPTVPATPNAPPPPAFSSIVCAQYFPVDYTMTCQAISDMYGLYIDDLVTMNPDGCSNTTNALPTSDLLCIVQSTIFQMKK